MRLTSPSRRPALLIAFILSLHSVAAQSDIPKNLPNLSDSTTKLSSSTAATITVTPTAATKTTQASSTDAKTDSTSSPSTITSAPTNTIPSDLPNLTSKSGSSYDGITGAPKLSGVYSYPAPTVPPTRLAPFMQHSSLPEGTVFIAVGSALAFIALTFVLWRALVAWLLHRSARRAQHGYPSHKYGLGHGGDAKSMLRNAAPFYSHGQGSHLSMEQLGPSKGAPKTVAPKGSLFFSPTAGAGMHTPGNRGSGYHPAGYYNASASTVGGAGVGPTNGATPSRSRPRSMADMAPQSHGYQRARSQGPSPPVSPVLPPMPTGRHSYVGPGSSSTVNLTAPPQGRAPSAYLEDLFENFPPGQIPGGDRGRS